MDLQSPTFSLLKAFSKEGDPGFKPEASSSDSSSLIILAFTGLSSQFRQYRMWTVNCLAEANLVQIAKMFLFSPLSIHILSDDNSDTGFVGIERFSTSDAAFLRSHKPDHTSNIW